MASSALAQWTPADNVSQTPGRFSVNPSMALDADGNVHLAYYDWASSNIRLYHATNGGGGWSNTLIGSYSASSGRMSGPFLAITPDQTIHIGYGIEHVLYEVTRPVSGGSWSSPLRIDEMNGTETWIFGWELDPTGGLHFGYLHLFDAQAGMYRRYKPLGGDWQPSELIHPAGTSDADRPVLAFFETRNDELYLSYHWNSSKIGYWQRRSPSGNWTSPQVVHNPAYGPRVAVNSDASEMASLYFYDRSNCALDFTVFARFSTDGGTTWTSEAAVSDNCWVSRSVDGLYDPSGRLHVLYQRSEGDGDDYDVWYRSRVHGTWTDNINLTDNSSRSGIPANAMVYRDGTLHLVYTDNPVDGYEDVYYITRTTGEELFTTPSSYTHTIWIGDMISSDTLEVANAGEATITYTLQSDTNWLSATPASGESSGEINVITLDYNLTDLTAGSHQGLLSITSPEAWNSPITIPITLIIQTVAPDFDGDGDVDQKDYGHLQTCFSGNGIPQSDADCHPMKLDADTDVDLDDLAILLGCLSGPNNAANPTCAP